MSITKSEFEQLKSELGLAEGRIVNIMSIPFKVSILNASRNGWRSYSDVKSCKIKISCAGGSNYSHDIRNLSAKTRAISVGTIKKRFASELMILISIVKNDIKSTLDSLVDSLKTEAQNVKTNSYIIDEFMNSFSNSDSEKVLCNWEKSDKVENPLQKIDPEEIEDLEKGDYQNIIKYIGNVKDTSRTEYKISDNIESYHGGNTEVILSSGKECKLEVKLDRIKIDPSNMHIIKKAVELLKEIAG